MELAFKIAVIVAVWCAGRLLARRACDWLDSYRARRQQARFDTQFARLTGPLEPEFASFEAELAERYRDHIARPEEDR